ncbi:MAG: ABC transporter ATP-binding protein [Bryobacteraceae bacterium]
MASVVEFSSVSKAYPVYARPSDRLKEIFTFQRKRYHRDFWALRDVSFAVQTGETFCILGENGSGKSTLLQLVASILVPTSGSISVTGRTAALLELGSGFNPEFSGHDNIYLNSAILGLSRKQIDQRYAAITEFADIGDFIRQPVKTYSSGMAMRLGFSVAIHSDPQILLVDEALAVGDIAFRQRCLRKVDDLRRTGVTILFVSHSIVEVKAHGDRALWLDRGSVQESGPVDQVVNSYVAAMAAKDKRYSQLHLEEGTEQILPLPQPAGLALEPVTTIPNIDGRHGNGRARVLGIAVLNSAGEQCSYLESNSVVTVRISVQADDRLIRPTVGFVIRNHLGMAFSSTDTRREGLQLGPLQPGQILTANFELTLPTLYPGHFSFSPAVADGPLQGEGVCDWIDNAVALHLASSARTIYGYISIPCAITHQLDRGAPLPAQK